MAKLPGQLLRLSKPLASSLAQPGAFMSLAGIVCKMEGY